MHPTCFAPWWQPQPVKNPTKNLERIQKRERELQKMTSMIEITRRRARSWWPRLRSWMTSERAWPQRTWCCFSSAAILETARLTRLLNFDFLKLIFPRKASNFLPMFAFWFLFVCLKSENNSKTISLEVVLAKQADSSLKTFNWIVLCSETFIRIETHYTY